MYRICLLIFISLLGSAACFSQPAQAVSRPRLVVGIMVDQMRWDFLYRYYDRYKADGGFRRMITKGFSCENAFIPYAPTVTAAGHASVYTGSVPSVNGVTGNAWWDRLLGRNVYCSEDPGVNTIGAAPGVNGQQSPKNMLVTTISDQIRMANNFRGKSIGIAIKDRGAIFPAGHSANAAYWYDSRNGNWISSSYYMQELPAWVQAVNQKKLVDQYYQRGWKTLYPINTYIQSTHDEKLYEGKPFGSEAKSFPYEFNRYVGTNYAVLPSTPYGNTFTLEMAKAALVSEELGKDANTDLLAISFSSTDYIGHSFGPNSIEVEDTYLRLDQELGEFFRLLDSRVGAGQWLAFLTADHGVANVPGFMKENKLPGASLDDLVWLNEMKPLMKAKFGSDALIVSTLNYQVHLNHRIIDSLGLDLKGVRKWIATFLETKEGVARAFDIDEVQAEPVHKKLREMIANGYYPTRSGDVQVILKAHHIDGGSTGTTHGLWNPYDAHIPLLWLGWNIKPGKTNREVYMSDIAPTIAAMLRIEMPGGTVGTVITELAHQVK